MPTKKPTTHKVRHALDKDERQRNSDQLRAIRSYVPLEWRWVSRHPWLSHGVPDSQGLTGEELAKRVRDNKEMPVPGFVADAAINLFLWATESQDKFWAAYVKQCEDAWKKQKEDDERKAREAREEAARKAAELASADSVERIGEIRKSLHEHLKGKGLAAGEWPEPTWPEERQVTA